MKPQRDLRQVVADGNRQEVVIVTSLVATTAGAADSEIAIARRRIDGSEAAAIARRREAVMTARRREVAVLTMGNIARLDATMHRLEEEVGRHRKQHRFTLIVNREHRSSHLPSHPFIHHARRRVMCTESILMLRVSARARKNLKIFSKSASQTSADAPEPETPRYVIEYVASPVFSTCF